MAALVILLLGLALPASAQAPATSPVGETSAVTEAAPAPSARARIDALRLQVDTVETSLRRETLTDADLVRLREQLDPYLEEANDLLGAAMPRLDQARARLDQLGPPPDPKAGGTPEPADIAAERTRRDRDVQEADSAVRMARALVARLGQMVADIADRRRTLLAQALFARSDSLLDPNLWIAVIRAAPGDIAALRMVFGDWLLGLPGRLLDPRNFALGLALLMAVGLVAARRRLLPAVLVRDPAIAAPGSFAVAMAALARLLLGAVPVAIGAGLVLAAAQTAGLVPARIQPVLRATLLGLAFVAFVRALGDALLAPGLSQWRLVRLGDDAARRLMRLIWNGSLLVVLARIAETVLQAIAAALPLSVAVRGLFAVVFALLLADTLRRLGRAEREAAAQEECLGPFVPTESRYAAPLRLIGWLGAVLVIGAAFAGFAALATFVTNQIVWIATIGSLLVLAVRVAEEALGALFAEDSRLATTLEANVGLRRKAIDQIAVLSAGLSKVALVVFAAIVVLAPWGVQSADMLPSLRAAFFGFSVGDVTISLSGILFAAFVFAALLTVTRVIKGWLDQSYLPTTDLDAGLRQSLSQIFGYLGVLVAALAAFGQLGLSLDKITIVAGALSVGIGFGLQSIVSNFVSGLILLWERPIRVGDLVVVGEAEGYVKRINVRATEVQTFDRATVVIPNANLISGVVRNRVRTERTGRILIPLTVPRASDPAAVRDMLLDAARAHPDILKDPAPRVLFKRIGEATSEFDLIAFVPDLETVARVTSDLNFTIHAALTREGMPVVGAEIAVRGLDRIEDQLEHIADVIEHDHATATKAAAPESRPERGRRKPGGRSRSGLS